MEKAGISLKRISLRPSGSVPNPRRARDPLSIALVTESKQVNAKEHRAGRSCTASELPSCYPGAPGTNGELALQDSSHMMSPGPSPLWVYDLSLGYPEPGTPIQPPSKLVHGESMPSRNPEPSSLADASPHTNRPHHCNATIQPGTWPLHPASIHLIGTIS